ERSVKLFGADGDARVRAKSIFACKHAAGGIGGQGARLINARQPCLAGGIGALCPGGFTAGGGNRFLSCALGFELRFDDEILPPDENDHREEDGEDEIAVITHEARLSRNRTLKQRKLTASGRRFFHELC